MKDFYKQCRFTRPEQCCCMEGTCVQFCFAPCGPTGNIKHTIAYIPEDAAKVGNRVELLSLDGKFWTVTEASEQSFSKDFIKENERNYKDFQDSLQGGGID